MDKKGRRGERPPFLEVTNDIVQLWMSFGCPCWIPTIFSEGGKRMEWRGRGEGRGKVSMTYERKDHPWRSNPAVLPHGFTQKSYLSCSLPACHPVPPLCNEGERQPSSFNLGTGSRYAGQSNCLATRNLLQWMD